MHPRFTQNYEIFKLPSHPHPLPPQAGGKGDKEFLQELLWNSRSESLALLKPYNPWWHRCPHLCKVGPEETVGRESEAHPAFRIFEP
jgi:hypothetical protein